ncbi:hypothetical protein NLM59_03820 [Weeksellaceae bacterium KMM 9724]|uniref:hypothetical protein n=1 Tax=Profundicola chukchiensis TaxID=2961959 RepID=UPI00243C2908|nr:hypothetical protein [Profundicola chukchiensis]MDG4950043.1 hypothetical protein [Profundicola chukchiensis]
MKKVYLSLFALMLVITYSCESETMDKIKDVKSKVNTASTMVGNVSNMEKNAKNIESRMESLKELTPITSDEFKDWMPDDLGDLKRNSYKFNTVMGSTGELSYENEERSLEVTIMDGAGETGSAVYASQGMLGALYGNFESESDTKKEEIVDRNGVQSVETYYKDKNDSSIRVTVDDRFFVNANGKNMTTDELYSYIEKLNVSDLN